MKHRSENTVSTLLFSSMFSMRLPRRCRRTDMWVRLGAR